MGKKRVFYKQLPKTFVPFGCLLTEHTVKYAQVVTRMFITDCSMKRKDLNKECNINPSILSTQGDKIVFRDFTSVLKRIHINYPHKDKLLDWCCKPTLINIMKVNASEVKRRFTFVLYNVLTVF